MLNLKTLTFYNPTKGNISYEQVIGEILGYVNKKPHCHYEVVVGCDSSSDENLYFPIAVVILRKGEGGRFFLTKIHYSKAERKRFYSFQQRILQEVILSCDLALSVKKDLKEKIKPHINYRFEYIHADIGTTGRTKDMIKEVVGLIKSNGFEAKIKPESFAASIVADRFS